MLLLTLLTTTSYAGCPPGHDNIDSCSDEGEGVIASADATATATSSSSSSAESASHATSSSGGNTQSINISESHPDDIKIRNVASPDTPNPYPTAPCRVGVSGGLSIPGGAFSGGGSVEDRECTLRETARSFKDLGVPEVGLYLLCTQSEIILGKVDKKGRREKGQYDSLGADECLRLVREFQGDTAEPVASRREIEMLQEQVALLQNAIGDHEVAQEAIEQEVAEVREIRNRPAPRPAAARPQIIQQQYITPEKRSKLAALVEEEIVVTGDEETEE